MDKREGGITIFRRKVFVSLYKIFHWRTLWSFRKSFYLKFSCIGGASRFCRNFLSHRTETKSFVKELFSFLEKFWYRKNSWIRGAYHDFQSKYLCLTVPKNFVRESYCFWEIFWFRKVLWMKRGVSCFSVETFWSHSAEKRRKGTL